jgi:hypothetical protein
MEGETAWQEGGALPVEKAIEEVLMGAAPDPGINPRRS